MLRFSLHSSTHYIEEELRRFNGEGRFSFYPDLSVRPRRRGCCSFPKKDRASSKSNSSWIYYRCRGLVPQGILRSIEFAVTKNKISPCNWKAFNRITREESSSRD